MYDFHATSSITYINARRTAIKDGKCYSGLKGFSRYITAIKGFRVMGFVLRNKP